MTWSPTAYFSPALRRARATAALIGLAAAALSSFSPAEEAKDLPDITATLKTSKGDVKVTLHASKAPVTVANFLNLARRGYYDGVIFHRVVEDFVIQGGDPSGTGKGGPGYFIENEIHPELQHDGAGILSMARKRDPDTNGSQFFITLDETPHLDGEYSAFGAVTEGMEAVMEIAAGDAILDVEIHDSTEALFALLAPRLEEWNRILDQRAKELEAAAASSQ